MTDKHNLETIDATIRCCHVDFSVLQHASARQSSVQTEERAPTRNGVSLFLSYLFPWALAWLLFTLILFSLIVVPRTIDCAVGTSNT